MADVGLSGGQEPKAVSPPDSSADPLRVLVVHNRYRSSLPSGENSVVDREIAMLRDAGVQVSTWIRESDDIKSMSLLERAELPIRPIWSHRDTKAVSDIIDRERPEILHLHNPYPLISPAVIRTAKRSGLSVVQSVHNYRHSCLNGLYFREGANCTLCAGRTIALPGIRHRCYRDSAMQSMVIATAAAVHHPTWMLVDRYFALNSLIAEQLRAGGVSGRQVAIKSNFVDDPGPAQPLGRGFFYAGRLEQAKGISLLLDAWEMSGLDGHMPLVIAGDGPLRGEVKSRADELQSVSYVGTLGPKEMLEGFRACAVVVVPSISIEGPPTVALEAFAHNRRVLALETVPMRDLIDDGIGWLAHPSPDALASALSTAAQHPGMGSAPRKAFEERFHADVVRRFLLSQYSEILARRPIEQ